MMIAFLAVAALAGGASQSNASSAQADAEQQCRSAISSKVNGEVTDFSVQRRQRIGTSSLLTGMVTAQQRPRSRPGEMTPMHIISQRFSYECHTSSHRKAQVTLKPAKI
jgi:hypothetical protein